MSLVSVTGFYTEDEPTAPCFERVLLQTVDLFRGEQSGSMAKLW